MSEERLAKEQVLSEIVEKLGKAQSVVLIDYRGLNVAEVTELRNQCRAAGIEYRVFKNTLVTKAAQQLNIEGLDPYLNGPSAFAFSETDAVAPAKIMSDFLKKAKKGQIKAGIVDGAVIDAAGVATLSELPPKEVLVAKLLGTLNAPIANFVGVLSALPRGLVVALNAIKEKKEA